MPNQTERARVAGMLLALMATQNITQSALAEKAGVAQSTISAILHQKRSLGKSPPVKTRRVLRSLASALGQNPTYFEQKHSGSTFGSAVKSARTSRLWTHADLAREAGVPKAYISMLERQA